MGASIRKYIPNAITCTRIILAGGLLLAEPVNITFIILYVICGLTDVADGYLARRWKVNSRAGALLDSVADVVFIAVLLILFIPRIEWQGYMLWWIGAIAFIRVMSMVVGGIKYRTLALIHTYGNKLAGLLLFGFPLLYMTMGLAVIVVVIGTVASVAAVEELAIMVSAETLDRDRKGIWSKDKSV